jgi:hypothetical protein
VNTSARGVFPHNPRSNGPSTNLKIGTSKRVITLTLTSTFLRGVDDAFFHVTCRQPFPENSFIHRDMVNHPSMTDSVKTGFNIALKNPLS